MKPEKIAKPIKPSKPTPPLTLKTIAEAERETIMAAMEFYGTLDAAKKLGIGKTTLYRKLKEYGAVSGNSYLCPERVQIEEIKLA